MQWCSVSLGLHLNNFHRDNERYHTTKTSKMCKSLHFYHLCGHLYRSETTRCSKEIARGIILQNQTTPDRYAESHKLHACPLSESPEPVPWPRICDECEDRERPTKIAEYLGQNPASKYEIMQQWSKYKKQSSWASRAYQKLTSSHTEALPETETAGLLDEEDCASYTTARTVSNPEQDFVREGAPIPVLNRARQQSDDICDGTPQSGSLIAEMDALLRELEGLP